MQYRDHCPNIRRWQRHWVLRQSWRWRRPKLCRSRKISAGWTSIRAVQRRMSWKSAMRLHVNNQNCMKVVLLTFRATVVVIFPVFLKWSAKCEAVTDIKYFPKYGSDERSPLDLMSYFKMLFIYPGSWLTTRKYPKTLAPWTRIIAHTQGAVIIDFHGTYDGRFLEVDEPGNEIRC